jgi:hypothetical protein
MANVFDQFDAPVLSQQGGPSTANVFDQFDEPEAPESGMDYAEGVARSAAQGVTLGFGDEIAAGFGSLFGMGPKLLGTKSYDEILGDVRSKDAKFRDAHPYVSTGAEVAGGIASLAGAPVRAAVSAPSVVGRIARSAGVGAGFGAASGFGNSEGGVVNRTVGAAKGAAVGGVAGPLVSEVVLPVAARTASGVSQAFRYGNQAVRNALNPQQAAINTVADRMVQSGVDPAAARAAIAPGPSAQLQGRINPRSGRNYSAEDMADIISRVERGEPIAQIGRDYGIGAPTVRRYVREFRQDNRLRSNSGGWCSTVAG